MRICGAPHDILGMLRTLTKCPFDHSENNLALKRGYFSLHAYAWRISELPYFVEDDKIAFRSRNAEFTVVPNAQDVGCICAPVAIFQCYVDNPIIIKGTHIYNFALRGIMRLFTRYSRYIIMLFCIRYYFLLYVIPTYTIRELTHFRQKKIGNKFDNRINFSDRIKEFLTNMSNSAL